MLDPAQVAPERIRPLTRREYDRLVEDEVFGADERIELLYGSLVEMSPQNPEHAEAIERVRDLLLSTVGSRARIREQSPFAALPDSEPEPDVLVFPPGDYSRSHPSTALLVVEVADSSLRKDRGVKARLYAEARVPEYWLLNLLDRVVERHTSPAGSAYENVETLAAGTVFRMASFPDVEISVAMLLPPPA
jgi:Uma2 family endonuclease